MKWREEECLNVVARAICDLGWEIYCHIFLIAGSTCSIKDGWIVSFNYEWITDELHFDLGLAGVDEDYGEQYGINLGVGKWREIYYSIGRCHTAKRDIEHKWGSWRIMKVYSWENIAPLCEIRLRQEPTYRMGDPRSIDGECGCAIIELISLWIKNALQL